MSETVDTVSLISGWEHTRPYATALRKRQRISCRPRHCVRLQLEFQTLVKHNLPYGRTKPTEDLLTAL
ncbi:hypothetical protein P3342_004954 [Pyrenophora teres f. teres]|nr:hypothetical protein P3342_004954 [Pyrenophora teres f. teres]